MKNDEDDCDSSERFSRNVQGQPWGGRGEGGGGGNVIGCLPLPQHGGIMVEASPILSLFLDQFD